MTSKSHSLSLSHAALARLPKIDLHRHLEGALRLTTLHEIVSQYDLGLPTESLEALRPYVQVTKDTTDYRNFLDKFNYLRRFYQSPEWIQRLAYEAMEDAARDNVRYLELRFTPPALAKARGFRLEEVADWVISAADQACRNYPEMRVWLIANVNRHEPLEVAEQVVQLALDRKDRGFVGLDIGGDEVNFPSIQPFVPLLRSARDAGLRLTVHAGEWTGPESVREAIESLNPGRIGHGVRVVEDRRVADLAREHGTAFEVSLTSNLHTGVVASLAHHPLREMMRLQLKTTINTDDPSISGTTLTEEYETATGQLGLTATELQANVLTAAASAFCSPAEQARLINQFEAEWQSHRAELSAA
jgi:adenosine deaminase